MDVSRNDLELATALGVAVESNAQVRHGEPRAELGGGAPALGPVASDDPAETLPHAGELTILFLDVTQYEAVMAKSRT